MLCCDCNRLECSSRDKLKNRQGDSHDLFETCTNQIKTRLFSARQEFCCSIEPRECPRSCKTHGVAAAPRGMKRIESDARLLHSQCLVDDVLFDQMNWNYNNCNSVVCLLFCRQCKSTQCLPQRPSRLCGKSWKKNKCVKNNRLFSN